MTKVDRKLTATIVETCNAIVRHRRVSRHAAITYAHLSVLAAINDTPIYDGLLSRRNNAYVIRRDHNRPSACVRCEFARANVRASRERSKSFREKEDGEASLNEEDYTIPPQPFSPTSAAQARPCAEVGVEQEDKEGGRADGRTNGHTSIGTVLQHNTIIMKFVSF